VLRVGLTGGIASGKSQVAEMFATLGVPVADTDQIAREVVAPGTAGLAAVRAAFGAAILAADGSLDRVKLRDLVFDDRGARRRLEGILHPLIREATLARLAAIEAPYVIVVVPLLLETDFAALVDRVLVVDCPPKMQLERVMRRDSVSRERAESIVSAQVDHALRLDAADDVIDNSRTIEHTREQVVALHRQYLELARDCPSPRGRAE
jgi:dephospho-CoA kinase